MSNNYTENETGNDDSQDTLDESQQAGQGLTDAAKTGKNIADSAKSFHDTSSSTNNSKSDNSTGISSNKEGSSSGSDIGKKAANNNSGAAGGTSAGSGAAGSGAAAGGSSAGGGAAAGGAGGGGAAAGGAGGGAAAGGGAGGGAAAGGVAGGGTAVAGVATGGLALIPAAIAGGVVKAGQKINEAASNTQKNNQANTQNKSKDGDKNNNPSPIETGDSDNSNSKSSINKAMHNPIVVVIIISFAVIIIVLGIALGIAGLILQVVAAPFVLLYQCFTNGTASEDLLNRVDKEPQEITFEDVNYILLEDLEESIYDAVYDVCELEVAQIADEQGYDLDLTMESYKDARKMTPYIYKGDNCNINYAEILSLISIAEFQGISYEQFDYQKFSDILHDDEFQRCLYDLDVIRTEKVEWDKSKFDEDDTYSLQSDGSISVSSWDGDYVISSDDASDYCTITVYGTVSINHYPLLKLFDFFKLDPYDDSDAFPSLENYDLLEEAVQKLILYKPTCFWGKEEISDIYGYKLLTGKLKAGDSKYAPVKSNKDFSQDVTDFSDIDLSDISDDIQEDIKDGLYTLEDYSYMVAVMSSESLGDLEGAVAVGYCVMYRAQKNHATVKNVVTAAGQFASPWYNYINKPKNDTIHKAAILVLRGEVENPVPECYFFFSASAVTCYKPGTFHKNVGGNMFYKQWGDIHTKHTESHICNKNKNK